MRILVSWIVLSFMYLGMVAPAQATQSPVTFTVTLENDHVLQGEHADVYILLQFDGADPAATEIDRPDLNLSLVLDRSGSMSDRGKLDYLKRASGLMIDKLNPTDILSVVEYDDQINVLWPAGHPEAPHLIKKLINDLSPRGSTNLFGGMEAGMSEVTGVMRELDDNRQSLSRVLLLSDGLANQGITDPKQIAEQVRQWRAKGVSVTTLGLGRDYDEDLMESIAENGAGRYYYVENPVQMSRIFAEELKLLYQTVAKNAVLRFKWDQGVTAVDVFGKEQPQNLHENAIEIEDIYAGESRSMLIKASFSPSQLGPVALGDVEISYIDAESGDPQAVLVPIKVDVSTDSGVVEQRRNKDVAVEVSLAVAEKQHKKAVALFESGKYDDADKAMETLYGELERQNEAFKDLRLKNKLEVVTVEREQMQNLALDPEQQKQYLKSTKQRLYKAKKGQRGYYLLQEGDRGFEVERLQAALKAEGFYSGPVDGQYRASLTDAVKAFQKSKQLGTDGVAGPLTLKELGLY